MKRPPPRAHHEVVDHDALPVQEWRPVDYTDLAAGQREYFRSGATRPVAWRRQQLEAMKALLADNRDRFFATLGQDLRRNDVDSDLMDVGFCIKEAEYALRRMHHWVKAEG
jgi:aldehyde dehydrogenase (NAD+)